MNLSCTIELYANRKLHYRTAFQGLPISIENRKGSIRRGTDKQWGPWQTKMRVPYGYIRGTMGTDGDSVDVFIGNNPSARVAYVVHLAKQPDFKSFDEDKVLLGFDSAAQAKACFMQHYDDSRFFGGMEAIPMQEFKEKVLQTKTEPQKLVGSKLEGAIELERMKQHLKKGIKANLGEPNVYDGGYAHIEPDTSKTAPPSARKPFYVPSPTDPRETDDKFGDVTRRKSAATKARRDALTRQHTDQNMQPLSSQQVSGFPSGTIGGFG
jgi:hypothetical protein